MKKLFSFLFFFAAMNVALAQSKVFQREFITLGGIESGSKVSLMQVLDYPELLASDKSQQITSFEMTINTKQNQAFSYKIEGSKMSEEAIAKLKSLKGNVGKISIKNVLTQKGTVIYETPHRLELQFEQ